MRPVGILGGMGPEATILLMQKVLAAVPARDDADHVPLIVHQNTQVPSRIAALIEGTGADPAPTLMRMARDLAAAGAQALAMPCNTAHGYADRIRAATALPFLDMTALATDALKARGARRVGMLASPATRKLRVFEAAFAAQAIAPVYAPAEDEVLALIRAVKAGARDDALPARLREVARGLFDQGCDHLLVACTELSLLTDALAGMAWSDSLDDLSDAVVRFARG